MNDTKPTDKQLADLAARNVMGWQKEYHKGLWWWIYEGGRRNNFDPCNDWNDMKLVIEATCEDAADFALKWMADSQKWQFHRYEGVYGAAEDEKVGRAVVKAALKSKGVDVQ